MPFALQIFMWNCIDSMPKERDYLQVFNLEPVGDMQHITHSSEQPELKMEYLLATVDKPITAKV